MRGEHPELAVHRHHRLRAHEADDRAQLLRLAVAGDVHGRVVLVQHLGAHLREPVDRVVDAQLVAGDRLRGDDHRVAGLDLDGGMVVVRDPRHRRHRLALAAGAEDQLLAARQLGELVRPQDRVLGDVHVAEVARDVRVLPHRAADERDLAPAVDPDVGRLLHPVHVRGERGDEDPALAAREDLAERLAHDALGLGDAGPLGVRGVAEQEVDAEAADLREPADVGALPVDRRVVELVVAGVDDAAARRLEHDGGRVGNRVRHPDELEPERAELDRLVARRHLPQLRRALASPCSSSFDLTSASVSRVAITSGTRTSRIRYGSAPT